MLSTFTAFTPANQSNQNLPAGSLDIKPAALFSDSFKPADALRLAVGARPNRPAIRGRAVERIIIWLVAEPRYSARGTTAIRALRGATACRYKLLNNLDTG